MRTILTVPALILAAAVSASLPAAAQDAPTKIEVVQASTSRATGPVAVGVDFDVLCSGWIGDMGERFPGAVVGAQMIDSQTIFMEGDVVYLDIGSRNGVVAGQEFWAVRPGETVWRFGSELNALGRFYDTPARLRVICAQESSSIAELTSSCSDMEIGDLVLPFEPIPIPLVRSTRFATSCDVPNGKTLGHIVRVKDRAVPVGQESIVYLDLGEGDGLQPGQFLTVFRSHAAIPSVRTILGEVAILSLREKTAVAKVTYSRDVIYSGDWVEVK